MTTSPTCTSSGTRLPLSSTRPGPTATTVPSCGFSLAVSGMTRPEAVVVSASLAWTTTRSSSGLMLTLVAVVTSVTPPSVSDGWECLRCCGTGSGHPPSRGSGASPCRLALYPRECQPLNRVPRRTYPGVQQAGRVPDDVLAQLRWLRTSDGTRAARLAARLQDDGVDLLPGLGRLRTEVGADFAGPAWELARLRARARPVFGADADVLLFTADTLEQAGRPELAARRAARLLAGADRAADLGCAAGTDTIALAQAGA